MEELLRQQAAINLFLLGFLEMHGLDRACWIGASQDEELAGVALLVPGRLLVPYCPNPEHGAAIGRFMRPRYRPCMVVGPRAECDTLWSAWSELPAQRSYDQRLYVCTEPPKGLDPTGFRQARLDEAPVVAHNSGQMEQEDLGRNPHEADPEMHTRVVRDRIEAGRTWVIEQDGSIVFQINVGTQTALGCQVGGTWVPPDHRGQGLATIGMRAVCRLLLRDHPRITLHVNEANTPAVVVYERSGFVRDAPFRLMTVLD